MCAIAASQPGNKVRAVGISLAMDAGLLPPLPFFSKKKKNQVCIDYRENETTLYRTRPSAIKLGHCNTVTSMEYVALIAYMFKENYFYAANIKRQKENESYQDIKQNQSVR